VPRITCCTETNFFLKSSYFKIITIVLMRISSISTDKLIKSTDKTSFTSRICEVKSFQIFAKSILSNNFESFNLTTIIDALSRIELLSSCVSDNFFPSGTSFFTSSCAVVIALNEKNEIAFSQLHSIVNVLILIEFF